MGKIDDMLESRKKIQEKMKIYSNNKKNKKKKITENRKAKITEPLFYPIKDSDSEIVILLKTYINESKISLQDIYDLLGPSQGYNLHYGLLSRSEIRLNSLQNWAKILKKRLVIDFVDE